MAATISVNFANEQDVYDESPGTEAIRSKKSVSSKLLQDVLGGGVVGGGYIQKTGGTMTGYLTLTGAPPVNPYHAATKNYVDDHAYTRRYYYECRDNNFVSGIMRPNTLVLSGRDIYDNFLYFFEKGDEQSLNNISRYLDVYRDGILQTYGSDYTIINNFGGTGVQGTTAIRFLNSAFENGTTFQVNIGSVGAFPVTFGIQGLSGGNGIGVIPFGGYTATGAPSGNVTAYIKPQEIAASSDTVALSTSTLQFVTPRSLSAYPMLPRAFGLFRKDVTYNTESSPKSPTQPYGDSSGNFISLNTKKIVSIKSDPLSENIPTKFRVTVEGGILTSTFYNAIVSVNTVSIDPESVVFCTVHGPSRTTTSFDFFVYDALGSAPDDVYEISVMIY